MSDHWKSSEGGKHGVAIRSDAYEARTHEIDNFLGRPQAKYSHYFKFEGQTYAVFSFRQKADADKFMAAFDGEPSTRGMLAAAVTV
ncbi:MAG: hypothetical protein G4V63_27155 [Candidatus Afipia apatlaquensis]|uniref:Uncharacterized protein n=1 Tax=Candidatus Afipia apatlaquensis TaxID=2712852 RepID=A0A7C9VKZ4_9BRAD|nr:hypothetical protein [Candidatus Afipia apatlaquensis]